MASELQKRKINDERVEEVSPCSSINRESFLMSFAYNP